MIIKMSATLLFIMVLALMSVIITAFSLSKTTESTAINQVLNTVNNYFKGSTSSSAETVEDQDASNNSA